MKKLIKRNPVKLAKELKDDVYAALIAIRTGTFSLDAGERRAAITGVGLSAIYASSITAFAAKDLDVSLKETLDTWYLKLLGISTPVAALVALFLLLGMMFFGEDGARTCKRWLSRVAIAYLAINIMGGILNVIQGLVKSQGYTPN